MNPKFGGLIQCFLKYFKKAAEAGNADAQFGMGVLYEHGEGVSKNDDEALHWYHLSAEQGNESAKNVIAKFESQRSNVEQVGRKVCRTTNGNSVTMTEPSPIFANSYMTYKGNAEFMGFVEGYSGNKIQIRISGLTFVGKWDLPNSPNEPLVRLPMKSFDTYKGSSLQIGIVIWDDYSDWSPCE